MKNLTKVDAKVNGVTVNKTVKVVTVEKTVKVVKIKTVSNYKENVIVANQKLNTERNSLGAYLDLLQKYSFVLCSEFQVLIDDIKSGDKAKYELLKANVKTTKNGKFNQFYTLQGLQKVCFAKVK
jgi:hypothetical protein